MFRDMTYKEITKFLKELDREEKELDEYLNEDEVSYDE